MSETYPLVENRLSEKASNRLYFFRSGGGLRVGRLEDCATTTEKLLGYGEDIQFEPALLAVEENMQGKPYKTEYWTGTSEASSNIDRWILMGHSFEIRNLRGGDQPWHFESKFSHDLNFKQYHEEVAKTRKAITKEIDGIVYSFEPSHFPSGTECTSGRVVENRSGLDPWYRDVKIEYRAETFDQLLVEVERKLRYWL